MPSADPHEQAHQANHADRQGRHHCNCRDKRFDILCDHSCLSLLGRREFPPSFTMNHYKLKIRQSPRYHLNISIRENCAQPRKLRATKQPYRFHSVFSFGTGKGNSSNLPAASTTS